MAAAPDYESLPSYARRYVWHCLLDVEDVGEGGSGLGYLTACADRREARGAVERRDWRRVRRRLPFVDGSSHVRKGERKRCKAGKWG